jgi:acyl carrier protein
MVTRVRELIAEVTGLSDAELPADPTPESVKDWDSLRHLQLMVRLEEEFGVEVPAEMAPALVSQSAIAAWLEGSVVTRS